MQRPGIAKALQDIEESIHKEQSTGELLAILSRLLEIAETSMDESRIDVGRINQMAEQLAEIRYLLDVLGSDPARRSVAVAAKVMAMRYRDLEGRVKEIRNDCVVSGKCT